MISNLILLSGTGFLTYGYYNLRKEGKIVKLFDEWMNLETYDIDFVRDLSELPQDKDIVIQGTILHNDKKLTASTDKEASVVYKEFVEVFQQVEESETDFFYKSRISENLQFRVGEPSDHKKQIQFDFIPSQINFYNPYKVKENIDASLHSAELSITQKLKLKLFRKKYNLTEFALLPNSSFSYIGRISLNQIQQGNTSNAPLYRFIPKVIMSDNKDYLLQHLDRYLVALNERWKRYLSISIGIMALHFTAKNIIFAPKKEQLPE
ncbi:hypothetical protein ABPG72_011481 [Tetrahymena utriculariae]